MISKRLSKSLKILEFSRNARQVLSRTFSVWAADDTLGSRKVSKGKIYSQIWRKECRRWVIFGSTPVSFVSQQISKVHRSSLIFYYHGYIVRVVILSLAVKYRQNYVKLYHGGSSWNSRTLNYYFKISFVIIVFQFCWLVGDGVRLRLE